MRPLRRRILHAFTDTCCYTEAALPGIFGVPLIQSIPYANVAISLFNEHGESYIYGYVPIVVAKCGVYLKEKGASLHLRTVVRANVGQQLTSRASSA
jgi:hypothetical protein